MSRPAGIHTANAIHEAAADLFYKYGYEATSLRQVAARVGIQVGSLYNHIHGKDELLRDIMVEIMDDLLASLDAAVEGKTDPTVALKAAIDCHIRAHAERARDVFIGNSELRSLSSKDRRHVVAKRDEYERILRGLIQRVGDERNADVIDARLQSYALVAFGSHVALWYDKKGPMSLDEIVSAYTTMVFRQMHADLPGDSAPVA
jgi:AcrR family transcriptional regulator